MAVIKRKRLIRVIVTTIKRAAVEQRLVLVLYNYWKLNTRLNRLVFGVCIEKKVFEIGCFCHVLWLFHFTINNTGKINKTKAGRYEKQHFLTDISGDMVLETPLDSQHICLACHKVPLVTAAFHYSSFGTVTLETAPNPIPKYWSVFVFPWQVVLIGRWGGYFVLVLTFLSCCTFFHFWEWKQWQ